MFRKDIIGRWEFVGPFCLIHEYLDRKFTREYYDSIDKKVPVGHSAEDIVGNKKMAKANHPFLYKVEKKAFSIDCWFSRLWDKIVFPRIWLANVKNQTHVIPTGLPRGRWHDTLTRLEHGFFELLKFYRNVENKRGFDWYQNTIDKKGDEPMDERQMEHYKIVNDALYWWEIGKTIKENEIEKLYDSMIRNTNEDSSIGMWEDLAKLGKDDGKREIYDKIHVLEESIIQTNKDQMKKVIDIYPELWS